MELIVEPISLISWFVLKVVKDSMAVHLIIKKLPLVVGTIIKHEFAFAMLLTIKFVSCV